MAHLSIRLPDSLLADLNEWAENTSRAEIIRKALELYRKDQIAIHRSARLKGASLLVRADSMAVNREFQEFEDDIHEA
jgi:metal-responsive CopG/Arc/MetJ family transcriptional regulator